MAEETEKERRYFQLQMCEVIILYILIKHSSTCISACEHTSIDCRSIYSFLQSWEFALCWPENLRLNSECCIRSKNCYIKHKYCPWTNAKLRVKKSVSTVVFFKVYIYSVFYWIQVFNEGEWNQNQERSWFGSASCGFLRCSSDVSFVNHCLSSFKVDPNFEKIGVAYYSCDWVILYGGTTAEEVSFEWLHQRILSPDSKVRTPY